MSSVLIHTSHERNVYHKSCTYLVADDVGSPHWMSVEEGNDLDGAVIEIASQAITAHKGII